MQHAKVPCARVKSGTSCCMLNRTQMSVLFKNSRLRTMDVTVNLTLGS